MTSLTIIHRRAATIFLAAVTAAGVLLLPTSASAAPRSANTAFDTMASEIIRGIERTEVKWIGARAGYGVPAIAVVPLRTTDEKLSSDQTAEFSRQMTAALIQQSGKRFRYVARGSLDVLISDIKASGLPADETAARIAELSANTRADILIVGNIRRDGDTAVISYQAVGAENGALFASTTPNYISLNRNGLQLAAATTVAGAVLSPTKNTHSLAVRRTIAETELLLSEHGYAPGPVDGILTDETRRALAAYQADSALPVNGRMTRHVVENLRRDTR